ncbi:MAG: hypothetical protein FJ284_08850 [Planctomycetes bacterium]|nr:hypothetical protein [Planctomycetota bacterium]
MASLLSIALFFKFNRLWSVRNLDLLGLVLLAPGLVALEYVGETESAKIAARTLGYWWIFAVSVAFLLRMLFDSMMVRRPMLEPNLTTGGLVFLGCSLLVFLLANVVNSKPRKEDVASAAAAERLRARAAEVDSNQLVKHGPGYPLLFLLPQISTQQFLAAEPAEPEAADASRRQVHETTARVMAILSQLAIVAGMVVVGWKHFENARLGIAAAVLFLLMPYTAWMNGSVDHLLPGALVIWAVAVYRSPFLAGTLIGLAIGTIYYPVFLLPLWCSFYWERGVRRFALGVLAALAALVVALWFTSPGAAVFLGQLRQMFGWIFPNDVSLEGFWALPASDGVFRLPVLAAFIAMMATLAIWPAPKNLGTLMSCTAAVLLGTQFWKAQNGGLFMAWWLPVLLLVIFRPNLENRVALLMLDADWFPRRRAA